MTRLTIVSLCAALAMLPVEASSATLKKSGDITDAKIEAYLMNHPEVLRRALANMQGWEQQQQMAQMRSAISANRGAIMDVASAVVAGNHDGDVTIVEFLDYNCGYCKNVAGNLDRAVAADGKVKVILKMLPILGDNSLQVAKLVLAAKEQGADKAVKLHDALIGYRGTVTKDVAVAEGRRIGIDMEKAVADAAKPEIEAAIRQSMDTAKIVGIAGTPTFLLGDEVFVGALPSEALQEKFRRARQGGG